MQNPEYVAEVAAEVRAAMARKNFKVADLAERLKISRPTASRRLAAELPFDIDELMTIADWLCIDALSLLAGTPKAVSA